MRKEITVKHRATSIMIVPSIALLLAAAHGCGEPQPRHGTATLVDLGEKAWHMEWASHGQYLLVLSGVERDETTQEFDYSIERVTAHRPDTWETVSEVNSDKHLADVFSCGDPTVVMVKDGGDNLPPGSYTHTYSFYRLDTGQRINGLESYGFYNRPWSDRTWFPYTYECDVGANVMYMRWEPGKVIALHGSTGEILREFVDPEEPGSSDDGPSFFIQPSKDRLVWTEHTYGDSEIRIYRLSTAELIQVIPVTPESMAAPGDYLLADEDHLVVITGSLGATCDGMAIRVIDLEAAAMVATYCMPNRIYGGASMMGHGTGWVVIGAHKPQGCGEIRSVKVDSGQELEPFDLCIYGGPGFMSFRELDRIFLEDTSPPAGGPARWTLLEFPGYAELASGNLSFVFDSQRLAPGRGLFVQQDYATDMFGVFDAVEGRDLDRFVICQGLMENTIRVDSSGRWASVLCFGDWSGVDTSEEKPRGAGFAIVDLEQFLNW